jgi:chemotaxis signal transduction protein
MSDPAAIYLNLLLFTFEGTHFAIDGEQVTEVTAYDGEQGDNLFWFHEELGYTEKTFAYLSPVIVTIRTDSNRPYRVIIDSMEDIAEFNQNEIRPFPSLLEPLTLRSGMWGVLPRNGNMVILTDFQRLLQQKRIEVTPVNKFKPEGDML